MGRRLHCSGWVAYQLLLALNWAVEVMTRFLRLTGMTVWTVSSLLSAGVTAFYGGLSILAVVIYGERPWNFPGDPPVFDLLIIPATLAVGMSLPLWLLFHRAEVTGVLRWVTSLAATVSLAICVLCAAGILERQDPRWSPIRNGIRRYGDAIAAEAGSKDRVLTAEEFKRFHDKYLPRSVPVQLRGYGEVRLRMAHGVYPYVGVDFSDASHALFNPWTMVCTCSD
jgi:hypothetical protein